MKVLLLSILCLLPCLAQPQQQLHRLNAEISGRLQGEDGSVIDAAFITAVLQPTDSDGKTARVAKTQAVARGGVFHLGGLPAGLYHLCAQAPGTTWLNPCEWGNHPPAVTLSAAQRTATVLLTMKKGVVLPLRLDDPNHFLSQHEGKTSGAHVLMGVLTDAGLFRGAITTGRDANGRDLRMVIPPNSSAKIVVYSGLFQLADGNGDAIPRAGAKILVSVPSGQQAPPLHVTIKGIGRP